MNNSAAKPYFPMKSNHFMRPPSDFKNIDSSHPSKTILLSLNKTLKRIKVSDIIRLEACSSYTKFFIEGFSSPILKSKPLKHYVEKINCDQFIRIHRSHWVNQNFIQSYQLNHKRIVVLKDGNEINISRRKLASVKSLKNKYHIKII